MAFKASREGEKGHVVKGRMILPAAATTLSDTEREEKKFWVLELFKKLPGSWKKDSKKGRWWKVKTAFS